METLVEKACVLWVQAPALLGVLPFDHESPNVQAEKMMPAEDQDVKKEDALRTLAACMRKEDVSLKELIQIDSAIKSANAAGPLYALIPCPLQLPFSFAIVFACQCLAHTLAPLEGSTCQPEIS